MDTKMSFRGVPQNGHQTPLLYTNFDALDKLTHAKRYSEKRIQRYEMISNCCTEIVRSRADPDVEVIIAGSRGEGVAVSYDNDVDVLFLQNNVKCTDRLKFSSLNLDANCVLFYLDFEAVPVGYSKLRLIGSKDFLLQSRFTDEFMSNLFDALEERNGHEYLRNDILTTLVLQYDREGWFKQQSVFSDMSGPARSLAIALPLLSEVHLSLDCRCDLPALVNDWCNRKRKHSWPGKDLIEKVRKLDVLVVPAGCKGSTDEELQWRISLTLAEKALVHLFNDIQIKLYSALKIIGKQELKPICENITSYILKNLLFWEFENTEIKSVAKATFDEALLQLLVKLKRHIFLQYLPCYMIPSKNMLQYKIFEHEKEKLLQRLDLLTDVGRHVAAWCPVARLVPHLWSEELEHRIEFIEVFEQDITAVCFVSAIDPKIRDIIWNKNNDVEVVINTVFDKALPLIPVIKGHMGLFHRISVMSSEQNKYCLLNGITRGYYKS